MGDAASEPQREQIAERNFRLSRVSGHSRWHWSHRAWKILLIQLLYQSIVYLIGGATAVGTSTVVHHSAAE